MRRRTKLNKFSVFFLFSEKKEKGTILLQNAEISQELSILKQELKNETAEVTELNESNQKLQQSLNERLVKSCLTNI